MIAFEQVRFSYNPPATRAGASSDDVVWTLRNLDFVIEDGSFFGVAGPTGSGKSTLLQHLNGLLHPTQGRVLVNGADLASKTAAAEARRFVGLVFQYPERQLFAATVFDDIAFGPRNLGFSSDEVDRTVRESMERVELDPAVAHRNPFGLSGGQRRRAAIAGILAMRPRTLVLDEPTAGLDPYAHDRVLDLIDGLHKEGLTIIMASHSMDDLARLCDDVLVINNGAPYISGPPESVFADAAVLEMVGLEAPHAQRIAAALRAAGVDLPERFYSPETMADAIVAATDTDGIGR